METQRTACFIIQAYRGQQKAAASLVRRAIRSVIGKRCSPACYIPIAGDMDARFVVEVTDREFAAITGALADLATAEGWDGIPVDAYHD